MCDHATMPLTRVRPTPAPNRSFPGTPVHSRSFPGTPAHVGQARAFTAAAADGFPAAGDAVLLVSELAANACAHTASGRPGGTFTVRVDVDPGAGLHAEVEDQGSEWDGDIGAAECPHGLFLLRELSGECGARRGERGWIVWFTMSRSQPVGESLLSPRKR
jgi:serine/threonine-protein kinase RsbW